jgi:endonuclease-8
MDCSIYTQEKWDALLKKLGPDPLNGDGPEKMIAKVAKSRKSIAELLMDQTMFAGVGNIVRAEVLYRARLNPFRPGKDVEERALKSMWTDAGVLLRAGMIDRRLVSTKPGDRPHRKAPVLKEEAHYVYRRNGLPCFVCGTVVKKQEMAGRNLFWCPTCQAE